MSTVKYGNLPIDKIQFGKLPNLEKYTYKFDFTQWVPTENLIDYEVSENEIVIKKFKPNVLLFRQQDVLSGENDCEQVCAYCRGTEIDITGLEANKHLFYKDNYPQHIAMTWRDHVDVDREKPKMLGICFYPYTTYKGNNILFLQYVYWWDASIWNGRREDDSSVGKLNEYIGLLLDGPNDHLFGIFSKDRKKYTIYPKELYYWNGHDQDYFYGFGIYTSIEDYTENGIINIENSPITIHLQPLEGYDIPTIECWECFKDGESIYHKEQTIESAWIAHNIASNTPKGLSIHALYAKDRELNYQINPLNDLELPFRYNCRPVNSDLKNMLIQYCEDPNTWLTFLLISAIYSNLPDAYKPESKRSSYRSWGMFSNSDITDLTLRLKGPGEEEDEPNMFQGCECPFSESDLENINIIVRNDSRIAVSLRLFYHAYLLKTITYTGNPMGAGDCSGMFEGCGNLQGYPSDLIDWHIRNDNKSQSGVVYPQSSNIGWFLDGAHEILEVPSFNQTNREANDNTIIAYVITQAFNCNKLLKIGPILDLKYIQIPQPSTSKPNISYNFLNCPNLTDVRIKHLNSGVWTFDDNTAGTNTTNSNLSKLDYDSVVYLFVNLMDLVNPLAVEGSVEYPINLTGTIYCPITWLAHLQTYKQNNNIDLIAEASAKGWLIYLGRVLYTEVNDL